MYVDMYNKNIYIAVKYIFRIKSKQKIKYIFITKTKWINDIKGKWEKNKQKRILGSKVKKYVTFFLCQL